MECDWRVCVSSTDALVGHSWAYGEICVLLTHLFVLLSCPGYTFFLGIKPSSNLWTDILTVYGLNDAPLHKDVPFGGYDDDPQFSGVQYFWGFERFKPPKIPQKGAWLGTFQSEWQSYKIAISPTAKIESTPNFDRIIARHSLVRG